MLKETEEYESIPKGSWPEVRDMAYRYSEPLEGWTTHNTTYRQGDNTWPRTAATPPKTGRNVQGLSGVLRWTDGEGKVHTLGHMGMQSSFAMEKGMVIVRSATYAFKNEGKPYVSLVIQLGRSDDEDGYPQRFGRYGASGRAEGEKKVYNKDLIKKSKPIVAKESNAIPPAYSDKHHIELRFYADTFDIRSRLLTDEDKTKFVKEMEIANTRLGGVLEVKFTIADGAKPEVIGDEWHYVPRTVEQILTMDVLPGMIAAKEWTLFLDARVKFDLILAGMELDFADNGRGQTWDEFKVDGRHGIVWNPKALLKTLPGRDNMSDTIYEASHTFDSDLTYYIKHGFGNAQELLCLIEWCESLQKQPVPAQFVKMSGKGSYGKYLVSIDADVENLTITNLLQIGDQLEVYFSPRLEGSSSVEKILTEALGTGENEAANPPDTQRLAWQTTVVVNDLIKHAGQMLLEMRRPQHKVDGEWVDFDTRVIESTSEYDPKQADIMIFMDIRQSTNTIRARLNALNEINQDWIGVQPSKSAKKKVAKRIQDGDEVYTSADADEQYVAPEADPEEDDPEFPDAIKQPVEELVSSKVSENIASSIIGDINEQQIASEADPNEEESKVPQAIKDPVEEETASENTKHVSVTDQNIHQFTKNFPHGYTVIPTEGTGLQCGLFALQNSMNAQIQDFNLTEIDGMKEIAAEIIDQEIADHDLAGNGQCNYRGDQLAFVLEKFAAQNALNLQLGVVIADKDPFIFRSADSNESTTTLWIHSMEGSDFVNGGHFSGIAKIEATADAPYAASSEPGDKVDDSACPAAVEAQRELAENLKHQRQLLRGLRLNRKWNYNFLEDLTDEAIGELFSSCTQKEKRYIEKFLVNVPEGLLVIKGAAGVGKTGFLQRILHAQLIRRKKILVMAATNQAVNNICNRTQAQVEYDEKYLMVRSWTEHIDKAVVKAFDSNNVSEVHSTVKKNSQGDNTGYTLKYSIAGAALKVAGLRTTTSPALLKIREKHSEFVKIMTTENSKRTVEQGKALDKIIDLVFADIVQSTDMMFATTTLCASSLLKSFVAECDIVAADEAACATEAEILIGWKGKKPLILAGDPEQLSPLFFSDKYKTLTGGKANSFARQLHLSLMERLILINWPYVDLTEQRRMPPGQFNLAKHLFYTNVTTAEHVKLSDPRFELCRNIEEYMCGKYKNLIESPEGEVEPILLDVRNSFCYRVPGGTSKGNTGTVHFTIEMIAELKSKFTDLEDADFAIVVPYLHQRRNYYNAKMLPESPIANVMVSTVHGFQGWENKIVFLDLTVAENLWGAVRFAADKRKLAVALTRHTQFSFVVGDPGCTTAAADETEEEKKARSARFAASLKPDDIKQDEGESDEDFQNRIQAQKEAWEFDIEFMEKLQKATESKYGLDSLKEMFSYFKAKGRYIRKDCKVIKTPLITQINMNDVEKEERYICEMRDILRDRRRAMAEGGKQDGYTAGDDGPETQNR